MTSPLPDLPVNALDQARELLHGALADTFGAVGWSRERVDRYPSPTPVTPGGWVDAANLTRAGAGLRATFPLVITVDGSDRAQMIRLDGLVAILWSRLEATEVPRGKLLPAGSHLEPLSAGPEQLDIGGPTLRSYTFAVQVDLAPRTLCPTALTAPTGDPAP